MKAVYALLFLVVILARPIFSAEAGDPALWTNRPITLKEAVEIALSRNGKILQAKSELEASHGVSMQARSIALPQVKLGGSYAYYKQNEVQPLMPTLPEAPDRRWFGNVRLIQSLYEGGRISSSLKTAKLTREQAVAKYRAVAAETLLDVRTAYFDVQLAEAQEEVLLSSTELLQKQAEDTQRRLEVGLLQKFDLLRAQVALASSRPKLFRARSQTRLAKTKLAQLLGLSLPPELWEKLSFRNAEPLVANAVELDLTKAIAQALVNRPEIEAQSRAVALLRERLTQAGSGYKPSVQAFTGYGGLNDDLNRDLYGWFVGVQLNWDLFDGLKTHGKIKEAQAELNKAAQAAEDLNRSVELEVRTAFATLNDAREILASQQRVQEQAEEALRIAKSRFSAGDATSLDVLAAENALTEVRSAQVQALRDYNVALATLERAIGMIEAKQ